MHAHVPERERGLQESSSNSAMCVCARAAMPSPAQMRATWASQSSQRSCRTTRTITASLPRGESFDTRHPGVEAWLSCFHLTRSWPVVERMSAWTSWFCQYLGVPIPQMQQLAGGQDGSRPRQQGDSQPPPLVCHCNRHVIDTHGDHIHTCKKHTGSTKDAHDTILDALEQI